MDNGTLPRDLSKYNLVNIATGQIEEVELIYVVAQDRRNVLWSRGIKTRLVAKVPEYNGGDTPPI